MIVAGGADLQTIRLAFDLEAEGGEEAHLLVEIGHRQRELVDRVDSGYRIGKINLGHTLAPPGS